MLTPWRGSRRAAAWLPLAGLLSFASGGTAAEVVILDVSREAREVGLAVGDRLVAWSDPGEPAATPTPLAGWSDPWFLDRIEIPSRGPLDLTVRRDDATRAVRTRALPLDLSVAPAAPEALVAAVVAAIAAEAKVGPETLAAIRTLAAAADGDTASWAFAHFAELARRQGQLELAHQGFQLAAASMPEPFRGELLSRDAAVLERMERFDEAAAAHREALTIWQRHDRDGLGASVMLSAQGSMLARRHDLAEAERVHERSLEIRRRRAPESYLVAFALNNLGSVAGRRNDLAAAESRLVQALELQRRLGQTSAPALANLGVVARLRGELERAEQYVGEAIAELERLGDAREVARKRMNLANIVADRGDAARAVAIYDALVGGELARVHEDYYLPDAYLNRALCLQLLGDFERAGDDLDRAESLLDASRQKTPISTSIVLARADVAFARGDLDRAAAACSTALAGLARQRPDTSHEAEGQSLCARVAAGREEWSRADALFASSIETIEIQQRRVGGGERGLVAFRQKVGPLYRRYADYLVARGRAGRALEILERYRAQALRALLRQRDLDLDGEAPAELLREREALGSEIERAYARLAKLDDDGVRDATRAEIQILHRRRDEAAARVRAASRSSAAAEAPPVWTVDELSAGLPAGTVALLYDLDESEGRLFVLAPGAPVEVYTLAAGAQQLAREVDRWVELVASPRSAAPLAALSARLSDTLLGPARAQLSAAQRLLVVPDGPLHRLSFAALPSPAGSPAARHLVERLSVVRDVSLSVFAASLGTGLDTDKLAIAVFGDPLPSTEATARFRGELGRLPATREEARSIGALFGDRAALYLGDEATESAARRALPDAGIAHFACHAVVDEKLPLDSALVLSADAASGGLLQAWEIAEELRLDGALVVLSACETARGGERGGEGIVGLVRALQVAGAESVVASLWRIADESSAELMKRFYRHLRAGAARDEALRRAQLELLAGPIEVVRDGRAVRLDASAPRHWAPFVLLGSPGAGAWR